MKKLIMKLYMKKIVIIFFLCIFIISNVFALCEEGQIDINSASAKELDKIIWVGPATAEKIINARPFESVDSLIDVSGIGDVKLADIKEQGLACVNGETEEINEEVEESSEEEEIEEDKTTEQNNEEIKIEKVEEKEIKLEIIKLEPKDIKSESNSENLNKNNYAMYGFVIFCILLGFLFILKKNNFNKNEFR